MTETAPPLRDRIAAFLVVAALAPYLVALSGAWWFLRHGDDGHVIVEVGSWPVALMVSVFLWVALGSAVLTAWQLLATPSVFWYRALPWRRVRMHLLSSGLVSVIAVSLLTGWVPLVATAAAVLLPSTCILAFSSAVSLARRRVPQPQSDTISRGTRIRLISFALVAVVTIAVLETARGIGDERLTVAAYATVSLLGLPWSAALFPIAFFAAFPAREAAPVVFDATAIASVAINSVVIVRLLASARYRLAVFTKFFRLG